MGANKRSPKLACESWFRTFLLVETLKKLSETLKIWSKSKNSHKKILLCEKKFVPSLTETIKINIVELKLYRLWIRIERRNNS